MRVVERIPSQRRLKQISIEGDVTMERICQGLTRSNGAERAGVNELAKYRKTSARSANGRLLGVEQKVHTCLHGGSAPQCNIRRLIATSNPERLGVLNLSADVRRVRTGHTRDNDRLD